MLAWGDEPVLEEAVHAVLASAGVAVDVVLVDNGCTTDAVDRLARDPAGHGRGPRRPTSASPVAATSAPGTPRGDFLAFVNGDAVVSPARCAGSSPPLGDPDVGLSDAVPAAATTTPTPMNSAGNPVHFSGLSWAGGLGDPAQRRRPAA